MAVTDPNTIAPGSSNPVAPLRSAVDYLRQQFAGNVPINGTTGNFSGALTVGSLIDNGAISLQAASVALAALNMKFGWISFKDTAGTLATNTTGGNITLSISFRTGTAAGDYVLTSGTAFANAFWFGGGFAVDTSGPNRLVVVLNATNPSHTTTALNFLTISQTASTNTRPTECMMFAIGA